MTTGWRLYRCGAGSQGACPGPAVRLNRNADTDAAPLMVLVLHRWLWAIDGQGAFRLDFSLKEAQASATHGTGSCRAWQKGRTVRLER